MTKLIQEKILKTEERPLSDTEIKILTEKRNKLLTYLLSSYIPLAIILIIVIASGPEALPHNKWMGPHEVSDAERTDFNIVAPWVCIFFFIMLTGFFIRYYLQTVHPLIKDIRKRAKLVLFIQLEKREPFFNRFFIYTPIQKKRQIERRLC